MSANRKTGSAEARAASERFRVGLGPFAASAGASRVPMVIADAGDRKAPIVFCSDSFCALVGREREAILTHPLNEFFVPGPDSAEAASILSALRSGRDGTWTLRCQSDDGTSFLTAIFATPMHDRQGRHTYNNILFVKLEGLCDDLIQKRDELDALYELLPGFIAVSEGPNHIITFSNAAHQKLAGRADLVGKPFGEALPSAAKQEFRELLDQVYNSGIRYSDTNVEVAFENEKGELGEPQYCDYAIQPIRATDGTITGLFCEGFDVTERHESATRMAELQRELVHLSHANAMGTMAATLAHELNQPLTAIAHYAEAGRRTIAKLDRAGVEQTLEALKAIADVTRRTGDLIRNFRNLTTNRQSQWGNFDIQVAIDECIRLVMAASVCDANFIGAVPEGIMVHGDRTQIQQVIINLLSNACESAVYGQSLRIEIKATVCKDFVQVSVKDSGTGVSVESAGSLFVLTESTKPGGMGIGLSVSRTIIEDHGGQIWLESSNETGSVFCFTLRLAEPDYEGG